MKISQVWRISLLAATCSVLLSHSDAAEPPTRRPLRRRDPLAAAASVGSSVSSSVSSSVRNRLVRPTTTSAPDDSDDSLPTGKPSRSIAATTKASTRRPFRKGSGSRVPSKSSADSTALESNSIKGNGTNSNGKDYKIVCYYTNWSQYRPNQGKFLPEHIEPDLCTHIIFAFGWMKKGRLSSYESNDETVNGKVGLYEQIMSLKKANPKLKVLLALGGWSFGTQKFKDMSATRYTRQSFVFSSIPFLRQHNYDGLDLDWEYPKGSDEKRNFVSLLKELKEAFDAEAQEFKRPRLLLTAAVPVGPDNINGGYDVPAVSSYLDFINVMAYDFHGKWESSTGHNAPLYAHSSESEWRKQLSVDYALNLWVRLGAPRDKLIVGMPTYGRTFTLSNPDNYRVNAAASGGGTAGAYTKESGFLAYYEICELLRTGTASYIWDEEMKVPYLVSGNQWIGFDDERAIRNKMRWIKTNNFGGAMVWTVDMDDFTGSVCGGGVKYPLIGAMREELLGIPRHGKGKDVEWANEVPTIVLESTTLPPPTKINVADILNKAVKKPVVKLPPATPANLRGPKVICYYTSWSSKRSGLGRFSPEDIDHKLCTHLVYAFGTLKSHKLAFDDSNEDGKSDVTNYQRVVQLKEKNPNLKVLLAIGGWAFGSTPFKELTSKVFRMNQFVYDCPEFLRANGFDGLDIDWEYPRGADDRTAFVDLLKELREAFEGEAVNNQLPRLLLTAAVPASSEAIAAGYDVVEVVKYVDFLNVMTYDFHGAWERQVGHNSPLYALESATSHQKKLTVNYGAKEWVRQGAPAEKIMIGMPTYGRSFTLVDPVKFDIGAPASEGGNPGRYTQEAGFAAYYEVCDFLQEDNTTLVWDNEQQVPFAYREDQWIGFDDERSLRNKVSWLKEQGFGGIMVWSMDMDDFRGHCGTGKYPLIQAMHEEFGNYSVNFVYDGPYEKTAASNIAAKAAKDPNEVSCDDEDGHISYHADKADCTRYYMCEGERKHHMPCPVKLVFNPSQTVCDWPENVPGCETAITAR